MAGNDGLIGSQAAYDALVDRVIEGVQAYDRELTSDDAPLPNLRHADPIAAFQEILRFELWVFSKMPAYEWADLMYHPDGPYYSRARRALNGMSNLRIAHGPADPPWTMVSSSVVSVGAIEAGLEPAGVDLDGIAIIQFHTTKGPYDVVFVDSGEIYEARDGFEYVGYATLLADDTGWRVIDLTVRDQ